MFHGDMQEDEITPLSPHILDVLHNTAHPASSVDVMSPCAVCLDRIEEGTDVISLSCHHVYHTQCIIHWLQHNSTCPICRTQQNPIEYEEEPTSVQSIRIPLSDLVAIAGVVSITLRYPNGIHIVTTWNVYNTIVDVFQYVQRMCSVRNQNALLRIADMCFKTTESYNYLNQQLSAFNISGQCDATVEFF